MEVEADRAHHRDDAEHRAQLRVAADVAERAPQSRDEPRGRIALDLVQLVLSQERERGEHGEEAERIDDEADAGAERGDHGARDRGADHARAVEQPGVQRDRVRQRARPDHLVRQRLAARRVERERRAAERGEGIDDRQRRGPGQRDDRERDRDQQRRRPASSSRAGASRRGPRRRRRRGRRR